MKLTSNVLVQIPTRFIKGGSHSNKYGHYRKCSRIDGLSDRGCNRDIYGSDDFKHAIRLEQATKNHTTSKACTCGMRG